MINATNPSVSNTNLHPLLLDQDETSTASNANANAATSTQLQSDKTWGDQGISMQAYDANFQTTRVPFSAGSSSTLNVTGGSINPSANQHTIKQNLIAQVNPDFRPANSRNGVTVTPRNGLPPVNRFTPYNPNAQRQFATDLAVGIGSNNRYQIQVNSPNVSPADARRINAELQNVYQSKYVKPSADNIRRYQEDLGVNTGAGTVIGGWAGGSRGAVAGGGVAAIAAARSQNERHINTVTSYADAVNEVLQRNNIPTVARDQLLDVKTY
jgi:hypothetical protein